MNGANTVLGLVVLMVLSRVKRLNKHQTWTAVSATIGGTDGTMEAHHRAPHSVFLLS